VSDKLRRLVDVLQGELTVREIGRKITSDTEQRLSKKQREFILREQAKTIQKSSARKATTTARWPSCVAASRRPASPRRRGARPSAS